MIVKSYKDLTVWQKSFNLTLNVYKLTAQFPVSEKYGLASQMQRCAVSIPSNIAEGQQRNNPKEFKQFLGIAKGSTGELETQLLLAKEIYKLDVSSELDVILEIHKMLAVLIRTISQIN